MIDVLDKTKLIDGVTCLVVQDRVLLHPKHDPDARQELQQEA
ncbi:MAG: hypothetical protein ACRD2A_20910 [Vicinamibacterales bacterium]